MPKAKEEFRTDLIRNLENRYLEANPTGGVGSKRGRLMQLGMVSYVAMVPDEVKKIAKILIDIIYDEANTEKLSNYCSNEAEKERDLIQQELFPAQKFALGLMMTPESAMEPGGAAAATPSSGRS
jgi:hypothetical protein